MPRSPESSSFGKEDRKYLRDPGKNPEETYMAEQEKVLDAAAETKSMQTPENRPVPDTSVMEELITALLKKQKDAEAAGGQITEEEMEARNMEKRIQAYREDEEKKKAA